MTGTLALAVLKVVRLLRAGPGGRRAELRRLAPRSPAHWAVVAWLGLNWLSLLWSGFPQATLGRLGELSLLVLWGWLVMAAAASRADWNRVLGVYLACGVGVAGLALVTFLLGATPLAAVWPFGNPNFLAGYLLIPLGLSFGLVLQREGGRRRWLLAAAALGVVFAAVWFTDSLSGRLAAFAVLALVAMSRLRPERRYRVAEVAVGVGILVGSVAAGVAYRLGAEGLWALGPGWAVRGFFWRWSLSLWSPRPLLGWGAGTVFPAIMPASNLDRFRYPGLFNPLTLHSHNEFLEVMVELGLVGLAAFLVMVYLVAKPLARAWMRWEPGEVPGVWVGLLAGFLGLNLQAVFSVAPRFAEVATFYWLAAGLLLAWPRVAAQGRREPRAPLRGSSPGVTAVVVLAAMAGGWLWYELAWRPLRSAWDFEAGMQAQDGGNLASAGQRYRRALSGRPSYPDRVRLLKRLGDLALRERRFEEAAGYYREAGGLAPGVTVVAVALADALTLSGSLEEGLARYRQIALLAPGYPDLQKRTAATLSMLARREWASGRRDPAIRLLKEAGSLRPERAEYPLQLARWLSEVGRSDEAEEVLRRAAESFAEDPQVREEIRRLQSRLRTATSPGGGEP